MTTPAVHIYAFGHPLLIDGYDTDCSGVQHLFTGSTVNSALIVENRPESVNSPKNASGWRNPTNWYHNHYLAKTLPESEVFFHDFISCGFPFNIDKVSCIRNQYFDSGSQIGQVIANSISGLGWLRDNCNQKAYANLKNQRVNLAVAFAERKETAELFSNVVTNIAKQVRNFRHKNPKLWGQVKRAEQSRLRKHGVKAPNAWLELQYGWNPLMQDVNGACQELSDVDRKAPKRYTADVKGRGNVEITDVFVIPGPRSSRVILECKTRFACTTRLFYHLNIPELVPFTSLGLTNPLEVIWERVPYSFVIDWFLPIGNWLSTFDSDFGWNYYSGYQSQLSRVKSSAKVEQGARDPQDYVEVNMTVLPKVDGFSADRSILMEPPRIGLPHFKNPFSAGHIANAMSLLVTAFR